MKKLISSLLLVAGTVASFGQGTISFNNTSGTLVTMNGTAVANTDGLTAVLWSSATQPADASSMTPFASTLVGELSGFAVAGRFNGGVATTDNSIAPASDAWFAVSIQSGFTDLANLGTMVGLSDILFRPTGGGTTPPSNLTTIPNPNPNGYTALGAIAVVPEPSVILLGLAGAGLLWFRRKK